MIRMCYTTKHASRLERDNAVGRYKSCQMEIPLLLFPHILRFIRFIPAFGPTLVKQCTNTPIAMGSFNQNDIINDMKSYLLTHCVSKNVFYLLVISILVILRRRDRFYRDLCYSHGTLRVFFIFFE